MSFLSRLAGLATVAAMLGFAGSGAFAQFGTRVSGTVASFDGQILTVAATGGEQVRVTIPAGLRITAFVEKKLEDIKPGDFVGSAAVADADGKLHAQEVHIFPDAMRGTGEGHRPMSEPNQTMTNATVAEVASAPKGQILKLKYPGGEKDIEVGPDARIVMIVPGDTSLLKPGAAVVVRVAKADDGSLTARFLQAEKDGVKPLN
jgi:hypothetical protein